MFYFFFSFTGCVLAGTSALQGWGFGTVSFIAVAFVPGTQEMLGTYFFKPVNIGEGWG